MIGILGTGHCVPKKVLTNDELSRMVDTSDEWIVSRTGIKERHIAEDETSLDLSSAAAKQALEAAGVQPHELGAVICATFTAHPAIPMLANQLLRYFDIQCPAFDISVGCSGFIYALQIAKLMAESKPVLVIACEILSRVTDWEDRSTCVLFGDGAGAAVVGESEAGKGEILACQLMGFPDHKDAMGIAGLNRDGTKKTRPSTLYMDGQEVYKFATRELANSIRLTLAMRNLEPNDIEWYIPHQANARIIKTAAKLLDVPEERFFVNIQHYGNTSAASVAIALDEFIRSNVVKKSEKIMMSAFGAGLTSASMLIRN